MSKKILLADDSITIQKVVELTFSEGDFEVTCVADGAAALQKLAEAPPDIALLDVIMPERSGYEICAHIRKTKDLEWMPVLLLTGAFEAYDDRRAREAGADGHITKPFESRALVAAVEKLLSERPKPGAAPYRPHAAAPGPPVAAPPRAAPQTAGMAAAVSIASPAGMTPASGASQPPLRSPAPSASPAPPPAAPLPSRAPAPAAPMASPIPAPMPASAPSAAAPAAVAPEAIDRAVKEAVAGIAERIIRESVASMSEKIVREVAWEVIPDLAESIVRRRIRELEDEADH